MRKTMTLFTREARRVSDKRLFTGLLLFLILFLIVLQSGIWKQQLELKQTKEFSSLQEKGNSIIKDIYNFTFRGLKTESKSSPIIAIFSNSTPFKVLHSYVDIRESLKIDRPQIGKSSFDNAPNKSIDLSWLIMVIGSILILAWGFGSFRNTEYIKFLMNFARPCQVFTGIILARVMILTLYLALLTGIIMVQFFFNGVGLNWIDARAILTFGLISLLLSIFMLIVGAISGSIRNTSKALLVSFIAWLSFVFVLPIAINEVLANGAISSVNSMNRHEMLKLEIFLDHFYKSENAISNLKSNPEKIEAIKKWNQIYWNQTFKKIEKVEMEMLTGIQKQTLKFHLVNIFTPVSFFSSVNNEISSGGYNFLVDFYKYVQGKQKGFVRYYIDHIFDDYSKIEPYMKKEDYVFQARPSLPKYFGVGLLLNALYILALGFFSYFMFTRSIFKIKFKDSGNMKDKVVSLEEGSKATCITPYSSTKGLIFNYFSGQKPAFPGKVIAADKKVDMKEINRGFIYICHPDDFPRDIRVANLVNLIICTSNLEKEEIEKLRADLKIKEIGKKYFIDLSFREKIDILFAFVQVRKTETVLFNELDKDLMIPDWEILVEKLDRIKEDRYLLFMTKSAFFSLRMGKDSWSSVAENEHILKYLS